MSSVSVIIVAAGKGMRLGSRIPKAFVNLGRQPMYSYSLRTFASIHCVREIVLVVPQERLIGMGRVISQFTKLSAIVPGGRERSDSVRKGLKALSQGADIVLIHDAARPLVSARDIKAVIEYTDKFGAAILAEPVTDTIKKERSGFIAATLDRTNLWRAQTPQGFRRSILDRIYGYSKTMATDDSFLAEQAGFRVRLVPASSPNFKITNKCDLRMAACLLKGKHST